MPAFALRLSAWGNSASRCRVHHAGACARAILNTVTMMQPGDRQLQADLVATWPMSSQLDVTALLSGDVTGLFYGGLAATTGIAGCDYHLKFRGNDIFGTLIERCAGSGGGVIRQFYDSSGDYCVDVAHESAWSGRSRQVGGTAQWRNDTCSNLFLNDLPVTYNISTSGSFGSGYSGVTIGLRAGF